MVKRPLTPNYSGPYQVIQKAPKYFTIDIADKHQTVSIDRLKPAHIDNYSLSDSQPEMVQADLQPTLSSKPTSSDSNTQPLISRG